MSMGGMLVTVEPVRLGSASYRDSARVHHEIGNALSHQPAMKPEAVATSTCLDRYIPIDACTIRVCSSNEQIKTNLNVRDFS
jgi:hypothetical protein